MKKIILNFRKQCPRRLTALAVLGLFAITAQAQVVTWISSDTAVATVDENGTVTPVSDGTATITATVTQNGKTVTSAKTVEISLAPPPITINGVKWAQGNVTGNCQTGTCTGLKIADNKYDYGLYFMWGGNTVVGYSTNGAYTSTPRYLQPGGTFPSSWPGGLSGNVYHSHGTAQGEWTANNPCTLIGGGWRMPSKAEFLTVCTASIDGKWGITGWTGGTDNGGYLKHTATGLIFPMAGIRYTGGGGGAASSQGSNGYYWTSTEYSSSQAWVTYMTPGNGFNITRNGSGKREGFSVRCVKD